jgi:hypothetical protein
MTQNINFDKLSTLDIAYHTPDVPPPYSYAYDLELNFAPTGLEFSFKLTYTDRDELDEDEIFEEGFTLNDDYDGKGTLPKAWSETMVAQLHKTSWTRNKKHQSIQIKAEDIDQNTFEGSPADIESWEYLLQEVMQGIYEVNQRELPLDFRYKEIEKAGELEIALYASFAKREAHITFIKKDAPEEKRPIQWKELKKLLKVISAPDYLPANARDTAPSKRGKYINPGDGKWYMFGKAALNPSAKVDSLAILEQQLKQGL